MSRIALLLITLQAGCNAECNANIPESCSTDAADVSDLMQTKVRVSNFEVQAHAPVLHAPAEPYSSLQTGVNSTSTVNDTLSAFHGPAQTSNLCRFAKLDWNGLISDANVQDQYIAAALRWDGRFASPGVGLSENGLTKDHVRLHADGTIFSRAGYTAPSKESLHLSMLAIVIDGASPLAWNFLIEDALARSALTETEKQTLSQDDLKALAETEARNRAERIIGEYERWRENCPGCGGFLNWPLVDNDGFILPGSKDGKVKRMPALDNGQMAWAMVALATVLEEKGHTVLAARYQAQVNAMKASAGHLYVGPRKRRCFASLNVKEKDKPVGEGQIRQKGLLADPFEGELMIMFQTLLADGVADNDKANRNILKKVKKGVGVREYSGPEVPHPDEALPNGPITVQKGWRFSAHEQWKFLQLPYLDNDLARRVFQNAERARSWDARLRTLPGMMAACYRPPKAGEHGNPVYMDRLGVHPVSSGYNEPSENDLVVSPYGAYPLIMADRGTGLAWYQAMLARPKMQCQYGSVEASEAFPGVGTDPRVAEILSWDTKVTTDLAMVGGTGSILRRFLQREAGRYEKFLRIVSDLHAQFAELKGEETPYAPPLVDVPQSTGFANCS
mmetsp:Transcript_152348/g.280777  ORF Transcript_152348/g.280777 Transcript_152348/m.280777 type:complete len:619 (+) Transcript_152348:61-1917(+)